MELNDTLKARLLQLLAASRVSGQDTPALAQVIFHHEGANLIGHVLLDLLEEQGFLAEDIDVVVGGDTLSSGICLAVSNAAYSRGLDIDTWAISKGNLYGPKLEAPQAIIIKAESQNEDIAPLVGEIEGRDGQVLAVISLWGSGHERQSTDAGLLHLTCLSEVDLPA